MWRMMPRLATATLTATMALAPIAAPRADAASMTTAISDPVQSYTYTVSGAVSGPYNSPISLNHQPFTGSFTTPGSIVIGQFVTNPLPASATLTYNNTPFSINLNVGGVGVNSSYPSYDYDNPNHYQYSIAGVLNGTISGDGSSSMRATVTSITGSGSGSVTTPPFPITALQINPQGIAAPNGSTDGYTTLTAQVSVVGLPLPAPAPEPSTVAVFGLALAGWAFRRFRRKGAEG